MTIKGSSSQSEASTGGFQFTVELSHEVEAQGQARGADFYWRDQSGSQVAGVASLIDNPREGCAMTTDADVCFPEGVESAKSGVEGTRVRFPAGTKTMTTTIQRAKNDAYLEGTETFKVGVDLGADSGKYGIVSDNAIAYGVIVDEESAAFVISQDKNTLAEGTTDTTVKFTVSLSHSPAYDVSCDYVTVGNTATSPEDFQFKQGTLTWPAKSPARTEKIVEVTINNDNVQEATEDFSLVFSNPRPQALNFPAAAISRSIYITDYEDATVSVTSMSTAQDESAPQWLFTASLSHATSTSITVPWNTQQNSVIDKHTAQRGIRYNHQSKSVTFQPGLTPMAIISLDVIDDNIQTLGEADEQTFSVVLNPAQADPPGMLSNQIDTAGKAARTGTVRMLDNEGVTISILDGSAPEGSPVQLTVKLSHQVSTDVILPWVGTDGSASTSGGSSDGTLDFSKLADQNFTVPKNSPPITDHLLSVQTFNDNVQELDETFRVTLSAPSQPANSGFSLSTPTATATITDNEGLTAQISDYTGPEPATATEMWKFTVTLSHKSSVPVTLSYLVSPGSALAVPVQNADNNYESDFVIPTDPLVVPQLSTSHIFNVIVRDDFVQEETETFSASLTGILNPLTFPFALGPKSTGIGTITDDEKATISIANIGSPIEKSNDAKAVFTVTLSHKTSFDVPIKFAAKQGTAVPFANNQGDYEQTSGTVTFAARPLLTDVEQTSTVTIPVNLRQDGCRSGSTLQDFFMDISDIPSQFKPGTTTAKAFLSDTGAAPEVSIAPVTGNEGDVLTFSVTLSACLGTDLKVPYFTKDASPISARANKHYYPTSGFVMFPQGSPAGTVKNFTVTTIDDEIQGPDMKFIAAISAATGQDALAWQTYNVQLSSNGTEVAGTIIDLEVSTISISSVTAMDNEKFVFTVSLSHENAETVTINWATRDGTATSGASADFVAGQGSLTFMENGPRSQTLEVKVNPTGSNTTRPPPAVVFYVDMSSPNLQGFTYNNNDTAGKGIIKSDLSTVALSLSDVTGAESSGQLMFTATLTGEVGVDFTVDVVGKEMLNMASSSRAVAGLDFPEKQGTLNFKGRAGDVQTVVFPVTLIDDNVQELTEQFLVSLTNIQPPEYELSVILPTAVATITDDDTVTVSILDASNTEGPDPDVVFQVQLSDFVYTDVTVTAVVAPGGSAGSATVMPPPIGRTGADDFVLPSLADRTFVIPAVQTSTTNLTKPAPYEFKIAIINDDVLEATETFSVIIASVQPATVNIDTRPAVGSIMDDEKASLDFSPAITVEGEPISFGVSLSHKATSEVTAKWSTEDGTAVAGFDYEFATGELIFPAFDTSMQFLTVNTINDNVIQSDEKFTIKIDQVNIPSLTSAGGIGIINGPSGEKAQIEISSVEGVETSPAPSFTFQISLSQVVNTEVTVDWATVDGSAVAGQDYTKASGTVTFPKNINAVRTVSVNLLNDNVQELEETFTVTASVTAPPPLTTAFESGVGVGTIVDNEAMTISIRDVSAEEGKDSSVRFSVRLSHGVSDNFEVKYTTVDGTAGGVTQCAVYGTCDRRDFIPASSVLTFPKNDNGQTQTFNVVIQDDIFLELSETFSVTIEKAAAGPSAADFPIDLANSFLKATATIEDNEKAFAMLGDSSATETDGTMRFPVVLSHVPEPKLTLYYQTTTTGSATDGTSPSGNTDFTPTSLGEVQFSEGFVSNKVYIDIPLIDDTIQEFDETFQVTLMNKVSPFVDLDVIKADAIGTIKNDDEQVTLKVFDVISSEDEAVNVPFIFNVQLSHPIQDYDVLVDYETADGSATASSGDYIPTSGQLYFPAEPVKSGPITREVRVAVIKDNLQEQLEDFQVKITQVLPDPSDVTLTSEYGTGFISRASGRAAQVTITDVTGSEKGLRLGGGNQFVFTVSMSDKTVDSITIAYATKPGSAMDGLDYTGTSGLLLFPAGVEPGFIEDQFIIVDILNDDIVEPSETFSVELSLVAPQIESPVVFAKQAGIGTIENDDSAVLTIDDATVVESPVATMQFTVRLSHEVEGVTSLFVSTFAGSGSGQVAAVPGELLGHNPSNCSIPDGMPDFVGLTNSRFDIPANTKEFTIPVVILNDNCQEADEVFQLNIDSMQTEPEAMSVTRGSQGDSVTGTIVDEEGATIFFQEDNVRLSEDDAATTRFQVSLSHVVHVGVSVDFDCGGRSNTAEPGMDFKVLWPRPNRGERTGTGTINFDVGGQLPISKPVLFQVVNDQVSEATEETFAVDFSNLSLDTMSLDQTRVLFTIEDDDDATMEILDATTTESAGTARFIVQLSHQVQAELTGTFSTSDDADFTSVGFARGALNTNMVVERTGIRAGQIHQTDYIRQIDATFTVPAYSAQGVIEIPIHDDNEQECDEVFSVSLGQFSPPPGYRITVAKSEAKGTIENDNENLKLLSAAKTVFGEAGSDLRYGVYLSHPVDAPVTLSYKTGGQERGNFVASMGTVELPAHTSEKTINIITGKKMAQRDVSVKTLSSGKNFEKVFVDFDYEPSRSDCRKADFLDSLSVEGLILSSGETNF